MTLTIGSTFTKGNTLYHVRAIDGDAVEAIEDGVGEPGNLEFEPGADLIQRFSLADLDGAEPTPTSRRRGDSAVAPTA